MTDPIIYCKHIVKQHTCNLLASADHPTHICPFTSIGEGKEDCAAKMCKHYKSIETIQTFTDITVKKFDVYTNNIVIKASNVYDDSFFTVRIDQLIENLPMKFGAMTIKSKGNVRLYRSDTTEVPIFTGRLIQN